MPLNVVFPGPDYPAEPLLVEGNNLLEGDLVEGNEMLAIEGPAAEMAYMLPWHGAPDAGPVEDRHPLYNYQKDSLLNSTESTLHLYRRRNQKCDRLGASVMETDGFPASGVNKRKSKKKVYNESVSQSFPVPKIARFLKAGKYSERVGARAPVYLAAVLEYLSTEVLKLAGNEAKDKKKKRILSRHIQVVVRSDQDLSKLLDSVIIANGGVFPYNEL